MTPAKAMDMANKTFVVEVPLRIVKIFLLYRALVYKLTHFATIINYSRKLLTTLATGSV